MTAATCNEEWDLVVVHGAGEALVVVGMAGEDCVWPDSRRRAGAVDVREHQRAAAVFRAPVERWMMDRDDDRSGEFIALHAVERGCQERNLAVIQHGVLTVLAGDDTGVFEHVAVEAEDADEGRLKREVHSGL